VRALRLVLHVQAYKWARLVVGAKAATVNRELVALSHGSTSMLGARSSCRRPHTARSPTTCPRAVRR